MSNLFEHSDAWVDKHIIHNPFIQLLKRKAILRKFITFMVMLTAWVGLLVNAYLSPQRVTYSKEQLATTQEFANGSGQMVLTNQYYSAKNGIILLEFETSDYTTSITKGINADNLEWQLFAKRFNDNTQMEVVPLTNNKIDVIIKNLPSDFEAVALNITNSTATDDDVDVDIQDYNDYKQKQQENQKKTAETDAGTSIQFMVTSQSDLLKHKAIKSLSREEFTLSIFNEELAYQKGEIKKLQTAIKKLETSIAEDEETKKQLEREAQYLTGENLVQKQKDIDNVTTEIAVKESKISQATDNIGTLDNIVSSINRSIKEVKDGTYQFNSPITSVQLK